MLASIISTGLPSANSPADTLGKVAVALLVLPLQKVLHFFQLICRPAANARFAGNRLAPRFHVACEFGLRRYTTVYPAVLLLFLIVLFILGRLGFGGLF